MGAKFEVINRPRFSGSITLIDIKLRRELAQYYTFAEAEGRDLNRSCRSMRSVESDLLGLHPGTKITTSAKVVQECFFLHYFDWLEFHDLHLVQTFMFRVSMTVLQAVSSSRY